MASGLTHALNGRLAQKRRAAREGSPSIVDPRSVRTAMRRLRGADLDRGEDPGRACGRPRHKTMRHWITSFRLLMGKPDIAQIGADGRARPVQADGRLQNARLPIEDVMRSSIVGEDCGGAGSASRP